MRNLELMGATSPLSQRWIVIHCDGTELFLPADRLVRDKRFALKELASAGILPSSKKEQDRFFDKLDRVNEFRPRPILDKMGWNGEIYALPSQRGVSKVRSEVATVPSCVLRPPSSKTGKLRKWKKEVAIPLVGNPIAVFALCVPFAAPLLKMAGLDRNPAFELVGSKGVGKTTLQRLAASVVGSPDVSGAEALILPLLDPGRSPNDMAAAHSDLPLLFDRAEEALVGTSQDARSKLFRQVAFELTGGIDGHRHCILMSSNEGLAHLLPEKQREASADDRVLVIPIADDRPHGVFNKLPRGTSGSQFARDLIAAAEANHGHALERFVAKLVKDATSHNIMRLKLNMWMREYRRRAQIDQNDGADVRRGDAFGLVYAAGRLAQECGLLPEKAQIGLSVRTCHRLHLAWLSRDLAIAERLVALARDKRTVVVDGTRKPKGLKRASMIVRKRSSGDELLILPSALRTAIPDYDKLRRKPAFRELQVREKGREQVKRQVAGIDLGRVSGFRLPADWDVPGAMLL